MKEAAIMIAFSVDMPLKVESTTEQFSAFSKSLETLLEAWKAQCQKVAAQAGIKSEAVHISLDYLSEDGFDEETEE